MPNRRVIAFVSTICFACALTLSLLAIFLKGPQADARELYKSKQLLISAHILDASGHFITPEGDGKKASSKEILDYYQSNITPMLITKDGVAVTFEEAGVDMQSYIAEHEKEGYATLPEKLIYRFPGGYIIPINGYGLWDAIYGYLAIADDGNTVVGATWYDQQETPGLGGEISTPEWLSQFPGKVIFQVDESGNTDFDRAPIGISVVQNPSGASEVQAIAGATITSTGVAAAYRQSLAPYRPFLLQRREGGNG